MGDQKEIFLYKGGTANIEQNTIKTNWHKFLSAISDGNQKLTVIKYRDIHYPLSENKKLS